MDFNKIQPEGYWKTTSDSLNDNFNKISVELDKISENTVKGKGLFSTITLLEDSYPNPTNGDWAFVGETFPAEIYRAENGSWVKSEETGGDPQINLSEYLQSEEITDITQILN